MVILLRRELLFSSVYSPLIKDPLVWHGYNAFSRPRRKEEWGKKTWSRRLQTSRSGMTNEKHQRSSLQGTPPGYCIDCSRSQEILHETGFDNQTLESVQVCEELGQKQQKLDRVSAERAQWGTPLNGPSSEMHGILVAFNRRVDSVGTQGPQPEG